MALLPADVPTGLVTGEFWFVNEDSVDAGTSPDLLVVTGTVTFTASVPVLRMPSKPVSIIPMTFDAEFNTAGQLVPKGQTSIGIELPATNSALLNPLNYTWKVDFNLKEAATGFSVVIPSYSISVPAGSTQDLTTLMPVDSSPGTITIQGPKGDAGPAGPPGTGAPVAKAYEALSRSGGLAYVLSGPIGSTQRHPFRSGGIVDSLRVWWRNFEERTSTAYTGQCDINGVWIGEAEVSSLGVLTGQFKSAPTQISGPIVGPTDGSAFCTNLVFPATFTVDPAKEYIISYGWTSGSGQQARSQGFGWTTGSILNAGQTTVFATLTPTTLIGLNTWVEINGPSSRIAWLGDSHSAGGASTLAVYDSPVNRLAWANSAVPMNLGAGGSTFGEWSTETDYKWQRLITNNVTADGWIYQLGQNDIYGLGTDLETCKTQSLAVMAIGRKILGPNMYLATIYPRNIAGQEAQNAVRIAYNDWLRTLPGRAVGIYDLAEAVTDATGNVIDSRYVTVDNIHLGTAGNARVASRVTHNIGKKGR